MIIDKIDSVNRKIDIIPVNSPNLEPSRDANGNIIPDSYDFIGNKSLRDIEQNRKTQYEITEEYRHQAEDFGFGVLSSYGLDFNGINWDSNKWHRAGRKGNGKNISYHATLYNGTPCLTFKIWNENTNLSYSITDYWDNLKSGRGLETSTRKTQAKPKQEPKLKFNNFHDKLAYYYGQGTNDDACNHQSFDSLNGYYNTATNSFDCDKATNLIRVFFDGKDWLIGIKYTSNINGISIPTYYATNGKKEYVAKTHLVEVHEAYLRGKPADTHFPYFIRKGISEYAHLPNLRESYLYGKLCIIIPTTNKDGLTFYQVIFAEKLKDKDGKETTDKLFAGEKKGAYFQFPVFSKNGRKKTVKSIYIAEGIATAASIHKADNSRFVVCCFDAGNMEAVIARLKAEYPKAKFHLLTDNDCKDVAKNSNVGLKTCLLARDKFGRKKVKIFLPEMGFKCDWNDYACQVGKVTDDVLNTFEVKLKTPKDLSKKTTFNEKLEVLRNCSLYLSEKDMESVLDEDYMSKDKTLKEINARLEKCHTQEERNRLNKQKQKRHKQLTRWSKLSKLRGHAFTQERYETLDKEYPTLAKLWEKMRRNYFSALAKQALSGIKTIELDVNFLPDNILGFQNNKVVFVKSPMGSGKTYQLRKLIAYAKANGLSVLYVVPYRSLDATMANVLGLESYQEIKDAAKLKGCKYLSIVINSLPKLGGNVVKLLDYNENIELIHKPDLVIFDESEQVFKQITQNIIDDKKLMMASLDKAIANAKMVICTDAHLSSLSIDTVKDSVARAGREMEFELIHNKFKRFQDGVINRYVGGSLFAPPANIYYDFKQAIKNGLRIVWATNSNNETRKLGMVIDRFKLESEEESAICKSIKEAEEETGRKINYLIINKHTATESKEVKAFLSNPNEEAVKYDVIIYSPSITSGVSIEVNHFHVGFATFYNNNNTSDMHSCMQQIGRFRAIRKWNVWCGGGLWKDNRYPTTTDEIFDNWDEVKNYYLKSNLSDGTRKLHPYAVLYARAKKLENICRNEGANAFFWLAQEDGWRIDEIDLREDVNQAIAKKENQEINKLRREINKQEILNAKQISDDEAQTLRTKRNKGEGLTLDEENSLVKYEIEEYYMHPLTSKLYDLDFYGLDITGTELGKGNRLGTFRKTIDNHALYHAKIEFVQEILLAKLEESQENWTESHVSFRDIATNSIMIMVDDYIKATDYNAQIGKADDICNYIVTNWKILSKAGFTLPKGFAVRTCSVEGLPAIFHGSKKITRDTSRVLMGALLSDYGFATERKLGRVDGELKGVYSLKKHPLDGAVMTLAEYSSKVHPSDGPLSLGELYSLEDDILDKKPKDIKDFFDFDSNESGKSFDVNNLYQMKFEACQTRLQLQYNALGLDSKPVTPPPYSSFIEDDRNKTEVCNKKISSEISIPVVHASVGNSTQEIGNVGHRAGNEEIAQETPSDFVDSLKNSALPDANSLLESVMYKTQWHEGNATPQAGVWRNFWERVLVFTSEYFNANGKIDADSWLEMAICALST